MSILRELLNADSIIQFHDKYKHSTVNFLQLSENEEISKPYEQGLLELTQFLDHMDINTNRAFRKEIKKMFSGYHHFQIDNYKPILIMMYKFLNSHCVSNDVSDHELSLYLHYEPFIVEMYVLDSLANIDIYPCSLNDGVFELIEHCCNLKFYRNGKLRNHDGIETNPDILNKFVWPMKDIDK